MKNERHLIGPPGTGKTTTLAKRVERAVEEYGADRILLASFTKAAISELNSRDLPIPKEQVGTIHSVAYHALSMPKIVETRSFMKQFSEEHPEYEIDDPTRSGVDDGYTQGVGKTEGAKLLQEYSRLRALLRPPETWPDSISAFAEAWEHFKDETMTMDFQDLISTCLKEEIDPKFEAAIALIDEAQDLAPAQIALCRFWGRDMEKVIFCGDGDQCIFQFAGAKADLGLDPAIPTHVLKQSYRVSKAVHAFSERIINLIPTHERLQREYLPTAEEGEVLHLDGSYKQPERWIGQVQKHLDEYRTVMILASCSYMLNPIIEFLRREGIPFANSYRLTRKDWNPLAASKRQVTAAMRVKEYMTGWRRDDLSWTGGELNLWLPLGTGVIKRGGRDKLAQLEPGLIVPSDLLKEIMPLEAMAAQGPTWLLGHLAAAHRRTEYQVRVGATNWADLETEPSLTVGTFHSVKGGEASTVVAFPDMSPEAAKAFKEVRVGPVARMFFVGATRARTTLYLGRPANPGLSLPWPG